MIEKSFGPSQKRIPVAAPVLGDRETELVSDAVRSGWVSSQGAYVSAFEQAVQRRCGANHALATCNGTAALHLALASLGIKEGDDVLVPALTFIATANAVQYVGARPIFADCDPEYWCVTVDECERVVTPQTRAVIVVHLYGHPTNMGEILPWARARNISVIEDAAEAIGATANGQPIGAMGDVGIFSFYGNKVITTGEGGMLVSNNDRFFAKARLLRDQFVDPTRRYWHNGVGFNYRMTNLQAALGVAQMERLDDLLQRKRSLAQIYAQRLAHLNGVEIQTEAPFARSAWWMFSVVLDPELGWNRDLAATQLDAVGIETRPVFHPLHMQPPYRRAESHPVAERIGANGLTLPSGAGLTDEELDYVASRMEEIAPEPRS